MRSATTRSSWRRRSSRSSRPVWIRASCGRSPATRRCSISSRGASRWSSSCCARPWTDSTSTPPRARQRRSTGHPAGRADQGPLAARRVRDRGSPGWSAYGLEEQVLARVRGLERSNDRRPQRRSSRASGRARQGGRRGRGRRARGTQGRAAAAGDRRPAVRRARAGRVPVARAPQRARGDRRGRGSGRRHVRCVLDVASIETHLDDKLRCGVAGARGRTAAARPAVRGALRRRDPRADAGECRRPADRPAQVQDAAASARKTTPTSMRACSAKLITLEMLHRQLRDRAHGGA